MNGTSKSIRRFRWKLVACVAAVTAVLTAPAVGQQDRVEVDDYGTVTLTVKDTDLAQVLEMLAIQSRKNIIASNSISATISANLYDVTFYEALDAILRVNDYGYIEEGNFIYVYTREELDQIRVAQRSTQSRVFELEYLAAADAYEFIQPLLSDVGQASARGDVPPGYKPDISDGGADSYAFTPTIVVNDYADNLDEISRILKDLDIAPTQVLVESTIVQTLLNEDNAWGVDFAIIGDMEFLDLTAPLDAVNNLLNGSDLENGYQPPNNNAQAGVQTVGNTSGPGSFKIGIMNNSVAFFLKVLDEVTDTTVLARPKVLCLNRQRAEVLIGQRVGYLSTTATETSTTQTVEFLDTGIQLIFRPFISKNGMVRMELSPSVSEATLRDVTDVNAVAVTIPDESTNEVTTNVRVPQGQTLVLGGLFRESTQISRRQTPFLGDIPLLGYMFRGQDDSIVRQEIIFLITPSVIEDDILAEMGDNLQEYSREARIGAREGLLAFSRDKMTDQYNQKALAEYNRGDMEKSLYYINNSLRLDQVQPEMIRFREQVTGATEGMWEQDVFRRVFERYVKERRDDLIEVQSVVPPAEDGPAQATAGAGNMRPGTVSSTGSQMTVGPGSLESNLVRSFMQQRDMPPMSSTATQQAATGENDAQFPFETFGDDSVQVVEAPERESNPDGN